MLKVKSNMPYSKYTKVVTRKQPGSYERLYTNGTDSLIVAPGGLPAVSNEYKKLYGSPVVITSNEPVRVISQQEFNDIAEKFKPKYDTYYQAKNGNLIDKIRTALSKLYK